MNKILSHTSFGKYVGNKTVFQNHQQERYHDISWYDNHEFKQNCLIFHFFYKCILRFQGLPNEDRTMDLFIHFSHEMYKTRWENWKHSYHDLKYLTHNHDLKIIPILSLSSNQYIIYTSGLIKIGSFFCQPRIVNHDRLNIIKHQ